MSLKFVLNKNLVKFKVLLNSPDDSRARLLNYLKILFALNKLENKENCEMLGNLKNSGGTVFIVNQVVANIVNTVILPVKLTGPGSLLTGGSQNIFKLQILRV